MNKMLNSKTSNLDLYKWFIVVVLLAAAVAANYIFMHLATSLKIIAWLVVLIIEAGIIATTAKGRKILEFAKEGQMELKKVVWPTRQETVQTTMIVVVMVAVVGLLLWGIDSSLLWVVGKVTHIS